MYKYKIADIVFTANLNYAYTVSVCADYAYSGEEPVKAHFDITKEDIEIENGYALPQIFPPAYLESLALYRKFLGYALSSGVIIMHSSALAVDDNAYLFLAPSGTGKSTHARLWRELLGDKVLMVNDDKPVIKQEKDGFYVYGTPWNGKHKLSTNTKIKIKGICHLTRGEENSITEISAKEMLMVVLNQTLRPQQAQEAEKLFSVLDKLLTTVELYKMECNVSLEAAKMAYEKMSGSKL